ncbi:MAG: NAD(P)/FAD-dependent oxidoreductase [Phycisphaerae bacterium]
MIDVAIIGCGAAGLATAIFAGRHSPGLRVVALDGAKKIGAKILVSGGGRCNVSNERVTPDDYWGGSRNTIRRVLAALPRDETLAFFHEIGVSLHIEENGKYFPDSNSAKTVLAALLAEAQRVGVEIRSDHRVSGVRVGGDGDAWRFTIETSHGELISRRCVLATGGLSLPKTGSDGFGYSIAEALGHSLVPRTPALVPLLLDGDFHAGLSGISLDVEICLRVAGEKPERLRGSLLWTHFGISGPVAMNASRVWHAARLHGRAIAVTASFLPEHSFESAETWLIDLTAARPRSLLAATLAENLPTRFIDALLAAAKLEPRTPLAHLSRESRRTLLHALLEWPLPIRDSRGYGYAEVTAGGVPLDEINAATMESRVCPSLYLVGEILDVDGRIGGFNFQWAWAGGLVAGRALATAARQG